MHLAEGPDLLWRSDSATLAVWLGENDAVLCEEFISVMPVTQGRVDNLVRRFGRLWRKWFLSDNDAEDYLAD